MGDQKNNHPTDETAMNTTTLDVTKGTSMDTTATDTSAVKTTVMNSTDSTVVATDNTSTNLTKDVDTTATYTTLPNEKSTFTDNQTESNGILFKFRHDGEFRHRFMHTAFVWWGFVTLGWLVALGGTAFPDIRLIIDKDLETASWLFTAGALGYMIGAFGGGLIFDRVNRLLMLSLVIIIMGLTDAAKPWCVNFAVLMVVNTVGAVASGGLDVGGNSHIASICGAEAGPFMHSIHFGFSIGGILSPLTAEPFLAEKNCKPERGQNTTIATVTMTTLKVPTTTECDSYGETHVHWAFGIGGALMLSAAIPFLVLYCRSGKHFRHSKMDAKMEKSLDQTSSNLPVLNLRLKIIFVFFLATLLANYCAIENRFSGLLMTFVVEHLDWTKSAGAHVNTVFWASFSAGRFLGIIVTRFLKPKTMLAIYLLFLTATFGGFVVASIFNVTWLIWALTAVSGLAMSIVFPSIFTWTAESILPVTGTISGIYLLTVSVANMVFPLLYGHLMDNHTQLWFTYLLAGQCVVCLILFWIILVLIRKYITPLKKPFSIQTDF